MATEKADFGTPEGRKVPDYGSAEKKLEVPHAGNSGAGASKGGETTMGKEERERRR